MPINYHLCCPYPLEIATVTIELLDIICVTIFLPNSFSSTIILFTLSVTLCLINLHLKSFNVVSFTNTEAVPWHTPNIYNGHTAMVISEETTGIHLSSLVYLDLNIFLMFLITVSQQLVNYKSDICRSKSHFMENVYSTTKKLHLHTPDLLHIAYIFAHKCHNSFRLFGPLKSASKYRFKKL